LTVSDDIGTIITIGVHAWYVHMCLG